MSQINQQFPNTVIGSYLGDMEVNRQAKIFEKLRFLLRQSLKMTPSRRAEIVALKKVSPLLVRFRGGHFPLKQDNGRKAPSWRQLVPWFRVQLALMVLMESGNQWVLNFRVHPHGALIDRHGLEVTKDLIREGITQGLRRAHGCEAQFFFVLEDRDSSLNPVRPHLHGSILIPRLPLPLTKQGALRSRWRRIADRAGIDEAQRLYGHRLIRDLLKRVSGNAPGANDRFYHGVDQSQNVDTRRARFVLINDAYVTYIFKNANQTSQSLPESRLVRSRPLTAASKWLWEVIREGENALG